MSRGIRVDRRLIQVALAAAGGASDRIQRAADAVGCSRKVIQAALLPQAEYERSPPQYPTAAIIRISLIASGGDVLAAARLIGCSKTPIRRYIDAQRASGHEIGQRRGEHGRGGRRSETPVVVPSPPTHAGAEPIDEAYDDDAECSSIEVPILCDGTETETPQLTRESIMEGGPHWRHIADLLFPEDEPACTRPRQLELF